MSANGAVHGNGQRIVFVAPATATPAAATYTTTPVKFLVGMMYVAFETIFTRASGGTTLDVYLQTSLDGGATWFDIHEHSYVTSDLKKITVTTGYSGTALTNAPVPLTPGDAALTANTTVPGVLGDRLRIKYVVAGSYVGTFSASAIVKG